MIVFDLECRGGGHRFEGWFSSSDDFAHQQERGLIACPQCGGADVLKAPMAPAVARKSNQIVATPRTQAPAPAPQAMSKGAPSPEAMAQMMTKLAAMQSEALKDSRWVGDDFAEQSRAMHYGERKAESIHGQTTIETAKALIEEGIEVAPLPFPVAPPGKAN